MPKPQLVLEHQDVFHGVYLGLAFKISHWGKGKDYTPGGKGVWNYYVYLPEAKLLDFAAHWLDEMVHNLTAHSWVGYDYYSTPAAAVHWYGGPTYYEKHGYLPGHRVIEYGCDFNHAWDQHQPPTFEQVVQNLCQTIEELQPLLKTPNL